METRAEWRTRPALLAALGAATGIAVDALLHVGVPVSDSPARQALAGLLIVAAAVLAFTIERRRAGWAAGFALGCGLAVGIVTWWSGGPWRGSGSDGWRIACALLAVAIAAPLFQAARDGEAWRFPYPALHGHAWANVVLWFAGWAFVAVAWGLAWLLAGLFGLIGLHGLEHLLVKGWFACGLTGAAFGGAIGLLRERDRVVAALQRLVTTVLAVLAPVLGAGLLLFLASLPFTGLAPLWQATKVTTPILLGCVIWALILANDVLADKAEDEPRSPVLRWGAMALGVAILPLALIATVSVARRIGQYGLSPDRLWAVTFVAIAVAYGLAYLVALARGRRGWGEWVRAANVRMAFGLCALALLLATPLAAFDALSAADQDARIADGRTPSGRIDWRALRFDMGEPGKAVVARLARSPDRGMRLAATSALKAKDRWELESADSRPKPAAIAGHARIFPTGAVVSLDLVSAIPPYTGCAQVDAGQSCVIRLIPEQRAAVLVSWRDDCADCVPDALTLWQARHGRWSSTRPDLPAAPGDDAARRAQALRQREAAMRGDIRIATVRARRLLIGGERPAGITDWSD